MLNELKTLFAGASDLIVRELPDGAAVVFIDGITDSRFVSEDVIRPYSERGIGAVWACSATPVSDANQAAAQILNGGAAIVTSAETVCFEAKGYPTRSIGDPGAENVFKGARDAFVENLRSNTALCRRKIKNTALRFTDVTIGRRTQTPVCVVHIEGLANPGIVAEAVRRLSAIDTDALISSAQIEEYISDDALTPFPQVLATERSDRFCAGLAAGRVGILADGQPLGWLVPAGFTELMRAREDFSENFLMASMTLLLRYAGFALSLLLPGLYLAAVTFHQEIIPTELAKAIISAKKDVPFTSAYEVFGMLITLELLIEAGLRLPKPVGQTASLVGGLIMGQAAVEAHFVSPAVVIIAAATAAGGFTCPNADMANAVRLWRLPLTLLAAFLGLFGLGAGVMILLFHLAGLSSFGTAYLSPFGVDDTRETTLRSILRLPLREVKFREKALRTADDKRQA